MARKGIFPFFGEDLQTPTADANWDGKSGFIKITDDYDITFDKDNYNGEGEVAIESGQAIYVQNSHSSDITVTITGGPFSDDNGDTATLNAGDSVTVLYHETHGFFFMGSAEVAIG